MLKHKRPLLFGVTACVVVFLSGFTSPARHYPYKSSPAKSFPLELDHVFVWVAKGAPEARKLENLGLRTYGETSRHVGQGTASKVFLFENFYFELIWIDDEPAVTKNAARTGINMRPRARWRQTGASPFGLGLHRLAGTENAIPFPTTRYWAEWMRPNTSIELAQVVTNYKEPMYFVVPEYMSFNPAVHGGLSRSATTNPRQLELSKLTHLRITTVGNKLTATGELLSRSGVLTIRPGQAPLMEITFDNGKQGKSISLQPQLPVVFKY